MSHYDEILNFYNNVPQMHLLNHSMLKSNSLERNLRGVVDKKFFLFRIANLYAYPH